MTYYQHMHNCFILATLLFGPHFILEENGTRITPLPPLFQVGGEGIIEWLQKVENMYTTGEFRVELAHTS